MYALWNAVQMYALWPNAAGAELLSESRSLRRCTAIRVLDLSSYPSNGICGDSVLYPSLRVGGAPEAVPGLREAPSADL